MYTLRNLNLILHLLVPRVQDSQEEETATTTIPDKMNTVLNARVAGEVLASNKAPGIASGEMQLTERAKYEISFTWIRTALHYAAELLKGVAVFLTMVCFPGAVAICVAKLFYAFCR
jgi:hypothetical protein